MVERSQAGTQARKPESGTEEEAKGKCQEDSPWLPQHSLLFSPDHGHRALPHQIIYHWNAPHSTAPWTVWWSHLLTGAPSSQTTLKLITLSSTLFCSFPDTLPAFFWIFSLVSVVLMRGSYCNASRGSCYRSGVRSLWETSYCVTPSWTVEVVVSLIKITNGTAAWCSGFCPILFISTVGFQKLPNNWTDLKIKRKTMFADVTTVSLYLSLVTGGERSLLETSHTVFASQGSSNMQSKHRLAAGAKERHRSGHWRLVTWRNLGVAVRRTQRSVCGQEVW